MKFSVNFLELSKEILGRGKYLRFQARGYSMSPAICDGEFILVKPVKATEIRLADIIFYRTADEKVVVHRVIKRYIQNEKRVFLTKGDSMPAGLQLISSQDVMGKVAAVERDGRKIKLDKGLARLKGLLRIKLSEQIPSIYLIWQKLKQTKLKRGLAKF